MLIKNNYPVLDFDENKDAIINPSSYEKKIPNIGTNKLIITFFKEVIVKLLEEHLIEKYFVIEGENDIIVYRFIESKILIIHGFCGCPACSGDLDLFTGIGINKVMFCGGGGVLDKTIGVGKIMLVEGALRDEGFSYHYLEPSRFVYANKDTNNLIKAYLNKNNIDYFEGLCWTTDAIFRETKDKIKLYKEEYHCKIVEMEQAGNLAVSIYRNISYGAFVYGGDDVSGEEWDKRSWRSRNGIRYDLVMLCEQLVQII